MSDTTEKILNFSKKCLKESLVFYKEKSISFSKKFNKLTPPKQLTFFIGVILISSFSGYYLGQKNSTAYRRVIPNSEINKNSSLSSSTSRNSSKCDSELWAQAGYRCKGDRDCQGRVYASMGGSLKGMTDCNLKVYKRNMDAIDNLSIEDFTGGIKIDPNW